MTFVVGVDGGGTRTRAVVVDVNGNPLGRAEVRGAVATADRPGDVAEAVAGAVRGAAADAGVALPAAVLWAGLAGAGNERARSAVEGALPPELSQRTLIGTDVEAAFHDAFGDEPGVLLIAGTGSVAWARGHGSAFSRVGGWGRNLGDEGSGFSLGSEALRRVTRAEDARGPATALRGMILDSLPLRSVEDLIHWVETASKSDVAGLAPLVVDAADGGDSVAAEVVDAAVEALHEHVTAAFAAIVGSSATPELASSATPELASSATPELASSAAPELGSSAAPDLVLWGGLVADGGPLRERLLARCRASGRSVATRALDPPMGAAKLALAALRTLT